jgi:hypothetical protein
MGRMTSETPDATHSGAEPNQAGPGLEPNRPTVRLLATLKESGQPVFEEVPVEVLGGSRYRLLASPGILENLARGDVFVVDPETSTYRVEEHGGNLCVQVWYPGLDLAGAVDSDLMPWIGALGGTLDGREQELSSFTIPASAGLDQIQQVFNGWTAWAKGSTWSFGNAYEEDGETLQPWLHEALGGD